MKIRIELQAYLQEYSPDGQPAFDYELPEGSRVRDLIAKLHVPDEMAAVIILNGKSGDYEDGLREGDSITLVPPLAGG